MADPADPRPDDVPDAARSESGWGPDAAGQEPSAVPRAGHAAPTSPAEPTPVPAAAGRERTDQPAPGEAAPVPADEPVPDEAASVRTDEPVPDEAELARVAEPARMRRAPKMGAFIVAGALVGIVLGLVVALLTAPGSAVEADGTAFISVLEGQGVIRFLSALTGGVVGGFVGGGLALLADRRSLRGHGDDPRS